MAAKTSPEGERIAKVLSRRGVASRREAERLIEAGEVKVNGKTITSAALNVTAGDTITVSGQPLPEAEPARLWLYYKPDGLVTTAADEKGRDTVFDHLPEDMPRVMSVGRLDLTSEGLLLLTNDGELKRRLELPSTGWLRKYRVRLKGNPTDPELEPLRKGVEIDGERFKPMDVTLDRHQGANAWLTIGLREGRNREIRRAIESIGYQVNRLIRVSYGPFRLGELKPGEVDEVRAKVLRDQLGEGSGDEPKPVRTRVRSTAKPAVRAPARSGKDAIGALADAWDAATRRPAGRPRKTGDDDRPTAHNPAAPRDGDSPRRTTMAKPALRRTFDDDAPRRPAAPKAGGPRSRSAAGDKPAPPRDGDSPRRTTAAKPAPHRTFDDDAPRRPAAPKAGGPRSRSAAGDKPAPPRDGDSPRRTTAKPAPRRTFDDDAPRRAAAPKAGGPRSAEAGTPRRSASPKPRSSAPEGPKGPRPGGAGKPGGRAPSGKPRSRG